MENKSHVRVQVLRVRSGAKVAVLMSLPLRGVGGEDVQGAGCLNFQQMVK